MPALIRPVDELGFPIPAKFDDPPAGPGEPRRAKPSAFQRLGRWRWVILILVPLLLFGRQLVDFGRGLVANFQVHRAERDWLRGDVHRALDHVDQAVAWEPDPGRKADVIFFRAELHDELGDLDAAMGDCNQVITLLTDGKPLLRPSAGVADAHDRRAYLHERLGHHREALEDSKEALVCCPAGPPQERATLLNDHAYMCALTQMELPSGEHDIEEAIQIAGNEPEFLDTRGYVRFRLGHYDAALDDMQMAIRIEEGKQFSYEYDPRLRRQRRNLAVMYHHRGEIYEKLGEDEKSKDKADFKQKASIDFRRAEQYGFDPKNGVF